MYLRTQRLIRTVIKDYMMWDYRGDVDTILAGDEPTEKSMNERLETAIKRTKLFLANCLEDVEYDIKNKHTD